MRIRREGWVHRALRRLRDRALAAEKESAMLGVALSHAYEGLVICDPDGISLSDILSGEAVLEAAVHGTDSPNLHSSSCAPESTRATRSRLP